MIRRFHLPPQAQLARWAIRYGPVVLPHLRRLYAHGRWRQLAILHARTLEDGAFSWEMHGGERVWVVWAGDDLVATYPHRPEIVDSDGQVLPGAQPTRRQDPDEVVVRRVRRRLSDVADRFRRDDEVWIDEDDGDRDADTDPVG